MSTYLQQRMWYHIHIASQPSPGVVFPSSHNVEEGLAGMILPSPHTSVQTLGLLIFPRVHVQSISSLHVASHPSPGVVFPSSQ